METILFYAISTLLTGGALFASIWLLERYNTTNKLPTAFLIGGVLSVFGSMGGFLLLPLFALLYLLVTFYDLSILKAMGVVVLMGLMLHFGTQMLTNLVHHGAF